MVVVVVVVDVFVKVVVVVVSLFKNNSMVKLAILNQNIISQFADKIAITITTIIII
jgi:hypothetical protein